MRRTILLLAAITAMAASPVIAAPLNADAVSRFPPPGRMVDVGGRKLHILCKGPEKGPTVVIESGALASSLYYWKAQDEVAKAFHVCVYDRAGLGWSDPAPMPRSLEDRADDLHTLLGKAGIKGAFVLVGHSMGGLIVRIYAHKYPRGLAGVVLVESSQEEVNARPDQVALTAGAVKQMGFAVSAAEAGISIPQLTVPNGPPEQVVALRASVFRAGQDDMAAMSKLPEEIKRLGGLSGFGDVPLVVIRRGKRDPGASDELNDAWNAAQIHLATLSTRSSLVVAENSGHNVHTDEPAHYREAVEAVLAMRARR